ncbi:thioesterase-like protein [Xylanimonas cellulosilytica DSM 15894]|uniref:Thioesterase-like protein n=1 Tax=Xylanimonas cellulosilytica (strain DSM 15894 / JCM 12276 / CECT 5975 / KCTC 9989 / LMG 20990 / NBRC 107835 / XIL07) TaxID=446471 RepID=D1BV76_XYLCX|nr:acyl-CoA thioesterase [Xylanimonas cellulosilytica]ACZ29347.1 thioesterase-like protein [Xylanimonas cellulosilytica DSM 15894]
MTHEPLAIGVARARVEWVDTDAAGIYHNSTVIRFVESAESRLMVERGLPDYFPSSPRVRFEADFQAPLFFTQDVTTRVLLTRIGTSSMHWEFEVWGEAFDGRPRRRAARGRYVTVHIGVGNRAGYDVGSVPWPESWVAALTGEPAAPASPASPADPALRPTPVESIP